MEAALCADRLFVEDIPVAGATAEPMEVALAAGSILETVPLVPRTVLLT
jgi:hypothetical protein